MFRKNNGQARLQNEYRSQPPHLQKNGQESSPGCNFLLLSLGFMVVLILGTGIGFVVGWLSETTVWLIVAFLLLIFVGILIRQHFIHMS